MRPGGLRVEHLRSPMGVSVERPRLSWTLPAGTSAQLAFELETTRWSSRRVDSSESVLVSYGGPPSAGGERVEWRVRVWTDLGESDWSEWSSWERGLDAADWSAQWVTLGPSAAPAGHRPTVQWRREFAVQTPVRRARLHMTAHGIYEAHLDGARIGELELTPGYTEYDSRLQVQVFDVTPMLVPGRTQCLAVEVSDGWYRGQVGLFRHSEQWGDATALLAQLVIEFDDGSATTIGTDGDWLARTSSHEADLIAGETIDLSADDGWRLAGAGGDDWVPGALDDRGFDALVASEAPPVRRIEEVGPVSITRRGARQIVDFGQNLGGWVRLSRLGPVGTELTLTHAEALAPDGDVTQANLDADIPALGARLPAGQIDTVVSGGDGSVFEPRHTTHGFRYVAIDGLDEDLTAADVTAVVVHSDLERTGWFACSDDRINRLHEAAVWSFRGNACDIPTDCPVRERAGWTGDWQIFIPTAAYLYDVAGFSVKWLRDLAVGQWPNGVIGNFAPMPRGEGRESPAAFTNGSAGWGDAAVIVPWELYRAYGDTAVLEESWPMMLRWMEFVRGAAEGGRHASRGARNAEPLPHERYLWDSGFHFGEWLVPEPSGDFDFGALMAADKGDTATAYYRHSTRLMAKIAALIGRDAEAVEFALLSDRIRAAWQAEYLDADGRVTPATQPNCVRALAFDLVDDPAPVVAQLAELITVADGHLATGFLATPHLLRVLADGGRADLAYELLLQRTWPSWLGMIDRGATTVWERWEGYDDEGMPTWSHNHYSKGAVVTFLHRHVAGIRPHPDEPAYRRFIVQPVPGGGIDWAEGRLRTPYGEIATHWSTDGTGEFTLDVIVPPGTECEVVLPDGARHAAAPGSHRFHTG